MDEEEASEEDGLSAGKHLGLSLPSPNAKASVQQSGSLEVLLAAKNKRIMEELTRYRVRSSTKALSNPAIKLSFAGRSCMQNWSIPSARRRKSSRPRNLSWRRRGR